VATDGRIGLRVRSTGRPIAAAIDWDVAASPEAAGEWYLVVFRSIRRADVDEPRLTLLDDLAHHEAMGAPGFVHYFKGPLSADRACLSFCMWDSRQAARAAAGLPAHVAAVSILGEAYDHYTLEFYRVWKRPGAAFEFEPYDTVPAAPADHEVRPAA
jgi:hypothetical protein